MTDRWKNLSSVSQLAKAGLKSNIIHIMNSVHHKCDAFCTPGPGCSKLTTTLVNVSLNFQKLISQICQYFLLKKCEKLLQCKSFSHFVNKKYHCIWL